MATGNYGDPIYSQPNQRGEGGGQLIGRVGMIAVVTEPPNGRGAPTITFSSILPNSPKASFLLISAYNTQPEAIKAIATKKPNELTNLKAESLMPNKSSIR